MSAPNLLLTIPFELGILNSDTLSELINLYNSSITNIDHPSIEEIKIKLNRLLNYLSYIVLGIFNLLLNNVSNQMLSNKYSDNDYLKYKGMLYNLYNNNNVLFSFQNEKKYYYFSRILWF
jgi:hypothetical protein